MEIKDQVVVISGGGSGLGAETARHLNRLGAKIALLDQHLGQAEMVAKEVGGMAVACDVRDANSVEAAISQVIKQYKKITINVNCAGIAPAARIVGHDGAMPLDQFRQVVEVNLIGTFNTLRLCAEQMSKQSAINDDGERGVIINTASVAAYEGQIGQAAYGASKGGVLSLTLPAAREFAKLGIRVMTIAPGIMNTPMMSGLPQEVQDSLSASVPFPRRLGQSKEYAQIVEQIVRNIYLNGSVIRLDGALRMAAK